MDSNRQKVKGIGGTFLRPHDATTLRAWYAEHLGIDIADWGGQQFEWTPGGSTTWSIFDADSTYLGRPDQQYMLNYIVEDLDAMLAQLRAGGVEVDDEIGDYEYGKFGWAVDCEGNRFELWQPRSSSQP